MGVFGSKGLGGLFGMWGLIDFWLWGFWQLNEIRVWLKLKWVGRFEWIWCGCVLDRGVAGSGRDWMGNGPGQASSG